MVKVRVELPPWLIVVGENALLIVGGVPTVRVAVLLVVPRPPFSELTAPVVFGLGPGVVPVTLTEMVHELAMATVPLNRLTDEVP
jgi:hypothetical protein